MKWIFVLLMITSCAHHDDDCQIIVYGEPSEDACKPACDRRVSMVVGMLDECRAKSRSIKL